LTSGTANVNLDLTQEDVAILRDVIRSYLSELHDEIVHTENYEFREGLQERQRRLQELLDRLGGESS
jgi:LPS O-antigen subunit length determinant protein (WzzB/FepE family)